MIPYEISDANILTIKQNKIDWQPISHFQRLNEKNGKTFLVKSSEGLVKVAVFQKSNSNRSFFNEFFSVAPKIGGGVTVIPLSPPTFTITHLAEIPTTDSGFNSWNQSLIQVDLTSILEKFIGKEPELLLKDANAEQSIEQAFMMASSVEGFLQLRNNLKQKLVTSELATLNQFAKFQVGAAISFNKDGKVQTGVVHQRKIEDDGEIYYTILKTKKDGTLMQLDAKNTTDVAESLLELLEAPALEEQYKSLQQ